MLRERQAAAAALKDRIIAAKRAANTSLIEAGNLLTAMGEASLSTRLYAAAPAAVEKALAMAEAATKLRTLAGETHQALADAREAAGLRVVMGGDTDDSPDPKFTSAQLRSVA